MMKTLEQLNSSLEHIKKLPSSASRNLKILLLEDEIEDAKLVNSMKYIGSTRQLGQKNPKEEREISLFEIRKPKHVGVGCESYYRELWKKHNKIRLPENKFYIFRVLIKNPEKSFLEDINKEVIWKMVGFEESYVYFNNRDKWVHFPCKFMEEGEYRKGSGPHPKVLKTTPYVELEYQRIINKEGFKLKFLND